jgi:hypothetical protein
MQIRNNRGELVGEINTGLTENGDRVTSSTLYDRANPVSQHVSLKKNDGTVQTTTVLGRKILP